MNTSFSIPINRVHNRQNIRTTPSFSGKINAKEDDFCSASEYKKQENLKKLQSTFVDIRQKDIEKISKMTNEDAAKYCFDCICNQWGLDDTIKPKYKLENECPIKGAFASYNFMTNELSYSKLHNKNVGKCWVFGLMRHEMEHYRQIVDVVRCDEFYNKYIESLEKSLDYQTVISDENLAKYEKGSETYNDILEWRNDPKLFKKDFCEQIKAPLDDFRKEILKRYPALKEGDKGYSKAKRICNSICKTEELNRNGILNSLKYFTDPSEFNACVKRRSV